MEPRRLLHTSLDSLLRSALESELHDRAPERASRNAMTVVNAVLGEPPRRQERGVTGRGPELACPRVSPPLACPRPRPPAAPPPSCSFDVSPAGASPAVVLPPPLPPASLPPASSRPELPPPEPSPAVALAPEAPVLAASAVDSSGRDSLRGRSMADPPGHRASAFSRSPDSREAPPEASPRRVVALPPGFLPAPVAPRRAHRSPRPWLPELPPPPPPVSHGRPAPEALSLSPTPPAVRPPPLPARVRRRASHPALPHLGEATQP